MKKKDKTHKPESFIERYILFVQNIIDAIYRVFKIKKKPKNKFFLSKSAAFLVIFVFFIALALWIGAFIAFLQGGNEVTPKQEMDWIFAFITIAVIVYFGNSFFARRNCFYVIELSPRGIKRTLFKRFRKVEINWDEIYEMRCYEEGNVLSFISRKYNSVWLVISKIELKETTFHQIIKRNDVIWLTYSKEAFNMIQKYTDKELINLPPWLKDNRNNVD